MNDAHQNAEKADSVIKRDEASAVTIAARRRLECGSSYCLLRLQQTGADARWQPEINCRASIRRHRQKP